MGCCGLSRYILDYPIIMRRTADWLCSKRAMHAYLIFPLLPVWMRWIMFSVCLVLELRSSCLVFFFKDPDPAAAAGLCVLIQTAMLPEKSAAGWVCRCWGVEKATGCGECYTEAHSFQVCLLQKYFFSPVSSSGGWYFFRGHLRGRCAAVRRTRSRAEWLTGASEVPSFLPSTTGRLDVEGERDGRERERE